MAIGWFKTRLGAQNLAVQKECTVLPNFLIAGGVATGTSFLSATLAHHPDIYLPKIQRPEPNFFHYSWKFDQGVEWYKRTWFHEVGDQRVIGDGQPGPVTTRVIAGFHDLTRTTGTPF